MFPSWVVCLIHLLLPLLISSQTCNIDASSICITGITSDNNWFYEDYAYTGCYGQYPYYYSSVNNYYIYWNYNNIRWMAYTLLGDDTYDARGPYNQVDLFTGIGQWDVQGTVMGYNTDPCLEVHNGTCSNAVPSNTCNSCTIQAQYVCVTGQTQDNDWFYKEYTHSGCFGPKPYYYSSVNNYYIYWNYYHNRWISHTMLGDDTYSAIGPYKQINLFAGNGQWNVQGTVMGSNTDPNLVIAECIPNSNPTSSPANTPSKTPTKYPTKYPNPTKYPTKYPTKNPTSSPI
eukprot:510645_1